MQPNAVSVEKTRFLKVKIKELSFLCRLLETRRKGRRLPRVERLQRRVGEEDHWVNCAASDLGSRDELRDAEYSLSENNHVNTHLNRAPPSREQRGIAPN
jgi:hypothetical protein